MSSRGSRSRSAIRCSTSIPRPTRSRSRSRKAALAAAKVEFANLQPSYASNDDQIKMGEEAVSCARPTTIARTASLTSRAGTEADRDTSIAALIQAKQILEFVALAAGRRHGQARRRARRDRSTTFPTTCRPRPQVDDAERNLRQHQCDRADRRRGDAGAQIELGRVAPAGQPVFAVVANTGLWVDANPKESDLTYVRVGQPRDGDESTRFPDANGGARICSIAPGTGAQFAILPPQNASGNWVKVVQRVPLRFCFDPNEDTTACAPA